MKKTIFLIIMIALLFGVVSAFAQDEEYYSVTFDANTTSTYNWEPEIYLVEKSDPYLYAFPTGPSRMHAYVSGWFKDPACTQVFDINEALTGDITLYANWVNSATLSKITFDTARCVELDYDEVSDSISVTPMTCPIIMPTYSPLYLPASTDEYNRELPDPSLEDTMTVTPYEFAGVWVDAANNFYSCFGFEVPGDMTLRSAWINSTAADENFVYWIPDMVEQNAGTIAQEYLDDFEIQDFPSDSSLTGVTTITRPAVDPSMDGYQFVDWFEICDEVDPDAVYFENIDGERLYYKRYNFAQPVPTNSDVLIYAVWRDVDLNWVVFIQDMELVSKGTLDNGGFALDQIQGIPADYQLEKGQVTITKPTQTPRYPGYQFVEWVREKRDTDLAADYVDGTFSYVRANFNETLPADSDAVFFAVWRPNISRDNDRDSGFTILDRITDSPLPATGF